MCEKKETLVDEEIGEVVGGADTDCKVKPSRLTLSSVTCPQCKGSRVSVEVQGITKHCKCLDCGHSFIELDEDSFRPDWKDGPMF